MRIVFFFLMLTFLLSACGGGSSSTTPSPGQSSRPIVSLSKSSLSSSSLAASSLTQVFSSANSSVTIIEQHFITTEDQSLSIVLDENIDLNGYAGSEPLTSAFGYYPTLEGGGSQPDYHENIIYYMPKENFYGQDRFSYWVDIDQDMQSRKKLDIIIDVQPAPDLQPKIDLPKNRVYQTGETVCLPFPVYPDDQTTLIPSDSTKLYFENALLEFVPRDDCLEVVLPAITIAGMHKILYAQVNGSQDVNFTVAVQMSIRKDDLEYFIGRESQPGQIIALVRTDNVSDEQYSKWISQHLLAFLQEPLIANYQSFWSFVVIKPAAEARLKSYGDIWSADPPYFHQFVSEYVPEHTEMVVLDARNFRATGGYPITMNLSNDSRVLFHELGHSHAKLGDEYTDAGISVSPYLENTYPNISNFTLKKIESLPWVHWIDDWSRVPGQQFQTWEHKSVGAFMGAFFKADRYYRPAYRSLMRAPGSPPSPVDEEAWVLGNYEMQGLLASATSKNKNGTTEISLSREWDTTLTKVSWFLNDIELTEFTNQAKVVIDEQQIVENKYSIKAVLTDITGKVRNPHAYKAFNEFIDPITHHFVDLGINKTFERTWIFQKSTMVVAKQNAVTNFSKAKKSEQWTSHLVTVKNGVHQLQSTRHYAAKGTVLPVTGSSHVSVEISTDEVGLLYVQGVSLQQFDIEAIPAPFINDNTYKIVHPSIEGAYRIKVYALPERELIAEYSF